MRPAFLLAILVLVLNPASQVQSDEVANKATILRFVDEIWNNGNLELIDEFFSPNFIRHGPTASTTTHGIEAFKEYVVGVREQYPDIRLSTESIVAVENQVMRRWTAKASNPSAESDPSAGNVVLVSGTSISRFMDGKIVEEQVSWDVLDLYQQLGVAAPMDPVDANKAVVQRLYEEVWNKGNLNVIDEIVYVDYTGTVPSGLLIGPGGLKQNVTETRSGFPDLHLGIQEMFAEGDQVVTHWKATGTHNGTFMGMEPTGKAISIPGMSISLIIDGRLVESESFWDRQLLAEQLGAGSTSK